MFQITQQRIGDGIRHAVTGEVGHQIVTVLATSETQACEICRALNEAAGIEIEDQLVDVSPTELHGAMEEILRRQSGALEVTAEEEAAWQDFDARR